MPNIVRGVGYTGTIQTLAWNAQGTTQVSAYLWGGGGGGGGWDAPNTGDGGSGGGAGFVQIDFTLQSGDVLQVAVGGNGGAGASAAADAAGGFAGAGLVSAPVFDTRSAVAAPAVIPVFNPQYGTFLNTWGVWDSITTATTFDRTYTVFFPFSAEYTFTASAKSRAIFSVDGVERFFSDSSTVTFEQNITLTQGNHTVRIQAETDGGAGAVALTIDSGISYSGSRGGNAGSAPFSGGGGGGGGATVLLLNSTVVAIAGGGGGGGGGGQFSSGGSAPGPRGFGGVGETAGQNGQNKGGADGAGAGGGGGGLFGGNGGDCPSGDVGGEAGNYGTSFGGTNIDPNGRIPGGVSNGFYPGGAGRGGLPRTNGTNGYAAFEFDLTGIYVHDNISFKPVQQVWIKNSGDWQLVESVYIKYNDEWRPVLGSTAPNFITLSQAKMGVNPRLKPDGANPSGGGGGGCKIICTKLHELGYLPDDIYAADQAFGEWLREHDPDAYIGYLHWARVVVDWMEQDGPQCMFWIRDRQLRNQRQQEMAIRWARRIALPWAQHMAYRMGAVDQDSRAGRWIMRTGLWVSRCVARCARRKSATKSAGIGYMMWAMFAVFWLLAGLRGR